MEFSQNQSKSMNINGNRAFQGPKELNPLRPRRSEPLRRTAASSGLAWAPRNASRRPCRRLRASKSDEKVDVLCHFMPFLGHFRRPPGHRDLPPKGGPSTGATAHELSDQALRGSRRALHSHLSRCRRAKAWQSSACENMLKTLETGAKTRVSGHLWVSLGFKHSCFTHV